MYDAFENSTLNQVRSASYGRPEDDFGRTAGMMTALGFKFQPPDGEARDIQPTDIPLILIMVKLSRESNAHKHDNVEDIIGYANCLQTFYTTPG